MRSLVVVITLGVWGCQSRAHVVVAAASVRSSGLLELGKPCAIDGDCTSTFCVDGVCCNTTCGGGVRDLLTCSNIYGQVPGLIDGTCGAIGPGDFCGALTSVNPCTWRGSTVNGGGQCPNPPGNSYACFQCTDSTQCDGAFPVCVNGGCVECDGNYGSGTMAACPMNAPLCDDGQCIGCGSCSGATPACNTLASTCVACNGDFGSGATLPCPSATSPACLPSGACAQCSMTHTEACTGTTPACDTTTNTCAACNGDFGSAASRACASEAAPLCLSSGACGKCTGNADCGGSRVCNITLGNCGTPCTMDGDCTSGEWCASNVCTPKTRNDVPIPNIAPANGTCTAAIGARVCLSGVCDTSDNRCGVKNSGSCGPPASDDKCRSGVCHDGDNICGAPIGETCSAMDMCRSGVCTLAGKCGQCDTDSNCGAVDSGMICLEATCVPGCRGAGGNRCVAGLMCTSIDESAGKCVACATDVDCGDASSGMVCNENRECVAGCRGDVTAGNSCGSGTFCTSADGSIGACIKVEGGGPGCSASPMNVWWVVAACVAWAHRRRRVR